MENSAFSRQQMIDQQLRTWDVFDPRVLCVFDEVRREDFVPAQFRGVAFADTNIPLAHGESMMTPKVEGRMLQALAVQPTDHVLEIGTGSGWVTALLATLGAEVLSIDVVPEFTESARQKLAAAGVSNTALETRDATTLDGSGAFDVIAITGSMPVYTPVFEELLKPGGRMFVIVGEAPVMEARLVTRGPGGGTGYESLFETSIGALRGFAPARRFAL